LPESILFVVYYRLCLYLSLPLNGFSLKLAAFRKFVADFIAFISIVVLGTEVGEKYDDSSLGFGSLGANVPVFSLRGKSTFIASLLYQIFRFVDENPPLSTVYDI
jgi:hypothetical protein